MNRYPAHWWAVIGDPAKPDWEILPSTAKAGEVILSKRHELGVLSNFAETPFVLDGETYASVESLWQMTKFPEAVADPRSTIEWPARREELRSLTGFVAKHLGDAASALMKTHGFDWVTYRGDKMPYPESKPGPFYRLIERAMIAKLEQNPQVKEALVSTGDLILRPDHDMPPHASPAHRYFEMWMRIRANVSN